MNRRRMSLVLALVVVLVVVSFGWLVPLSRNSQAAPAPSGDAAFKGKVLLVSTTMMNTFLLEKAQVQKIGDHSFLVGKGKGEGRMGAWYKDRTVRLQMEHVISITEFDDLKDAKKAWESGGGTTTYPGVPLEAAPAGAALPPPPPAVAPPPGK